MENPSIYSVFEQLWRHILRKFNDYISTDVFESHAASTKNPHMVTAEQVGLDKVNNTSDEEKPISTLTQAALDGKSDTEHNHDADDITDGVLRVEYGGTGHNTIVDTNYDTPRYRASALISYEEYPSDNGVINWMYE